jgi:hypothetical protein
MGLLRFAKFKAQEFFLVWWHDATVFLLIWYYFIENAFILSHSHSTLSIAICRGSSLSPHCWSAQWEKPPWGLR